MWQATESRPAWLGEPTVPFARPSVTACRCPVRRGGGEHRFSDGRRIRSPWTRHRRRTRHAFQRRVPLRARSAVSLRGTRQASVSPFPGVRGRKRRFFLKHVPSLRLVAFRSVPCTLGMVCNAPLKAVGRPWSAVGTEGRRWTRLGGMDASWSVCAPRGVRYTPERASAGASLHFPQSSVYGTPRSPVTLGLRPL